MKTKNLCIAFILSLLAFQACTTDDVSLTGTEGPGDESNLYSIKDNAFGEYLKYLSITGVYSKITNEEGATVVSYLIDTVESKKYSGPINLNKSGTFITKLQNAGLTTADVKIQDLDGIQFFPGTTSLILISNELTSIELTNLVNLTELNLNNNWIGSLDLTKNSKLAILNYNASNKAGDGQKLTKIDLTKNTELVDLILQKQELAYIDLSKNTKLKTVDLSDNVPSPLTIPENIFNNLTSAKGVVSGNPSIPDDGEFYTITDKVFGEYLNYRLKDQDIIKVENNNYKINKTKAAAYLGELDLSKNGPTITELTNAGLITAGEKITNLDGIQFFTGITALELVSNELTTIDVTALKALTVLGLNNNKIGPLDVTKNTKLTELSYNASSKSSETQKLTSIDLSKNTALTALSLKSHLLSAVDLTNNTGLTSIDLSSNKNSITIPVDLYDSIKAAGGTLKGVNK